nr:hypothetical protein [uncultured Niameybacter sp.]
MRWKRYTILSLACILILIGLSIGCFKKEIPAGTESVLKTEVVSMPQIDTEEQERLFNFSLSILEESLKGKIALIDPRLVALEEDGYNRYFLKIEGIGVDNRQTIDLYHFYFILQKSQDDKLYMMPSGSQVLIGEVDNVKEDILISMLKFINEWEINN